MTNPPKPERPPLFSGRVIALSSVFGVFLTLLLAVSLAGVYALSGIRGYVLGEGLWAKAQKRAVIALERYAATGDERFHDAFLDEISITLGDRLARTEMERPDPDLETVREGFQRGQLPDGAIDPMANLFRWGRDVEFVDRSIRIWADADRVIDELLELAGALYDELEGETPDQARIAELMQEIRVVDDRLTGLEEAFSRTFDEGASQMERWIFAVLGLLTLAVLIAGIVAVRFFLSQIRRREEAQRVSEGRYRELFERNVVGVLLASSDGQVLEVNEAFAQVLGYANPEELRGVRVDEFFELEPEALRHAGEPREVPAQGADGRRRFLLLASAPVRDPATGAERLLLTATDVTERRALEERLARARKMEAMGQLAGGVAHDFNNLLTVILGHAEILEADLLRHDVTDPVMEDSVREIVRTSQTAAGLTRQLLTFSRSRVMEQQVVDLNESVEAARALLVRLLPSSIEFTLDLAVSVEPVKLSPVHLEQLLLNMAINARDAMEAGGHLTIRTGMRSLSEGAESRRLGIPPGSYVVLQVEDTGHGMDAQTLGRVFEPFFTTKEPERGTGMGLATVYGIVAQAGGTVDVRSTPGVGTVFTVYLPVLAVEETLDSSVRG